MSKKTFLSSEILSEITSELINLGWLQENGGVSLEYVGMAIDEVRRKHGLGNYSKSARYRATRDWEQSLGGLVTRIQTGERGGSYLLKATSENTYDYVKCYQNGEAVAVVEETPTTTTQTSPTIHKPRHEKKGRRLNVPTVMDFVAVSKDEKESERVFFRLDTFIPNLKNLLRTALNKYSAVVPLDKVVKLWDGAQEKGWTGENIVKNLYRPLNKLAGYQRINFRYRICPETRSVTFYGIEGVLERLIELGEKKGEKTYEEVEVAPVAKEIVKENVYILKNSDIKLVSQRNRVLLLYVAGIISAGDMTAEDICELLQVSEYKGIYCFNEETPDSIKSLVGAFPEWFSLSLGQISLRGEEIFNVISLAKEMMTTTIAVNKEVSQLGYERLNKLFDPEVVYENSEVKILKITHDATVSSLRKFGRLFNEVYPIQVIDGEKNLHVRSTSLFDKDFNNLLIR